jgi:signal transduction histidine kinase
VLMIILSLFRLFMGYELLKFNQANAKWEKTTLLFIISTSLSGFGLGISAVLAEYYSTVQEQLFIFALLIGFSGGAVATLSPILQGYIAHVFGIMLPQIIALFFSRGDSNLFDSEDLERLIGILGILYMIVIIRAGMILHNTFLDSITLKNQLTAAKNLAEAANKAKSKFISSISHELRTPLHAIMGYSQLLEIDETLTPEKKEYSTQIMQAGNHLLALIDQILEFSKIEAGKLKLNIVDINLFELLQECERLMQNMATKRNVLLTLELPEKNVHFAGDPLRLKQVLLNLISNAIKYNKPGGTVDVSVIPLSKKRIRISVKDSGYGIPPDIQHEVFVSFNRLGRESGDQEGTGIGLVISQELITSMGGKINFESTPEVGSHFWIDLNTAFFSEK